MTKITIKHGRVKTLLCEGHAKNSLVCGVISTLCVAWQAYYEGSGRKPLKVDIREGYTLIKFRGKAREFEVIETALRLLAENYPADCEIQIM
jgi:uncharacterized protein YsxB (DUF464 family)